MGERPVRSIKIFFTELCRIIKVLSSVRLKTLCLPRVRIRVSILLLRNNDEVRFSLTRGFLPSKSIIFRFSDYKIKKGEEK